MELSHFSLSKRLNNSYREKLLEIKAHFRGNESSCSLVSLSEMTPEVGVSGITESNAADKLKSFNPHPPKRSTPEKRLQSWIILSAIRNGGMLPFGENLTFVTSEFAGQTSFGKKIVNDILAIDDTNSLVVIELKSERSTKVLEQAIEFKKHIEEKRELFAELTQLMTEREWSGKIRCIAVWEKAAGKARPIKEEYREVEIFAYEANYSFSKEQ